MKTVPLLEVVKEMKRGPFGSAIKKEFFVPKGYKVYEQQNAIYDDPKLGRYFIDKKKYEELKGFAVKSGDFLISCSGTIGRITRLPNDVEPGVINQALLKITLNEEVIDPNYFLYLVRSLGFQNKLLDDAKGVAIKNVAGMKDIKAIPVPLFDLKTQKKIVQKIDSLFTEIDAGVEELKKTKVKLELYKQSVLNAAIRGKLVPQDPKDEPASKLLERIRAEKEKLIKEGKIKKEKPLPPIDPSEIPFELPKGWEWVRLGDVLNQFLSGYAFKSESYVAHSKYQVIRLANVKPNNFLTKAKAAFIPKTIAENEGENFRLINDDILITMTGTRGKRDYLFTCKVIESSDTHFYLNQRVGAMRFNRLFKADLFLSFFKHQDILTPLYGLSTGTANQANIGVEQIRRTLIPFPPLMMQSKLKKYLDEIFNIILSQQIEIDSYLSSSYLLKQSILKQAFEGKLI